MTIPDRPKAQQRIVAAHKLDRNMSIDELAHTRSELVKAKHR
jgi:hypothetical protein